MASGIIFQKCKERNFYLQKIPTFFLLWPQLSHMYISCFLPGLGLGQMNQQNLELGDGVHLHKPHGSHTMDVGVPINAHLEIVDFHLEIVDFFLYPLDKIHSHNILYISLYSNYYTLQNCLFYFLSLLLNFSLKFYCEKFPVYRRMKQLQIEHLY